MDVGQNIKKYRKEIGLTQVELGKRVGVIQNDVHRWEAGKIIPSLESIRKIAKALNMSTDSLLFSEKEKKHLKAGDKEFLEKIRDLDKLSSEDRITILNLIDTMKHKAEQRKQSK